MATRKATKKTAKKPAKKKAPVGKAAASKRLDRPPDQLPVTERRAEHLAEISGVDVKKIAGKKISEVHELLKWKLDPPLLLFRRICGQVVKKNPITGEMEPVPNATVHVEDTDCSFLGFFPGGSPWGWLYPVFCSREELAAVRTDECGRFCVYLPYWDFDRILRWRRRRICYFRPFWPRIRDLLELLPEPPIIREPQPGPDPAPIAKILPEGLARIRDVVSAEAVETLEMAMERKLSGEDQLEFSAALEQPAFAGAVPPPLPPEMTRGKFDTKSLGESLEIEPKMLRGFDPRRFIGPFIRCFDIFVPEWVRIFDVPDITFRVTQDYDLDGVEEEIYSESYFDVRWNAGPILDVTLEASGNALSAPHCEPKEIRCLNKASIEAAGYLDLEPAYHDDTTGYCVRMNRPTTHGWYPDYDTRVVPANAPYAGNLNLHGCFRLKQATHYRLRYSYRATPSDPWGPQITFTGVTWTAPRQGPGAPIPFIPDVNGWYAIQSAADLVHPNWLMPWRTWARADGNYQIWLQLGKMTGGAINVVDTSAPRMFEVDNSKPESSFVEVRWRETSEAGPWTALNSTVVLPTPVPDTCPIIYRPTGQDIHVQVQWTAAAKHLRDARLDRYGCGGGSMEMVGVAPPPVVESYRHWHTGPFDNSVSQTNVFLLRGTRPPGCYTVFLRTNSRAFNPQDFDAASTFDWWKDQVFRWRYRSRAISVVDV